MPDRLGQTEVADIIRAKPMGEVPEIEYGLADQLFRVADLLFKAARLGNIHRGDVQLGQAQHLTYIIVDLLGDMPEGLLLYLQPGLEKFPFIREPELLFFLEITVMATAVKKKKGNDKCAQQ